MVSFLKKLLKFFNIYKCCKCNSLYFDKHYIFDIEKLDYICDNCLVNYDDFLQILEKAIR
jgi:hypothetical protein